MVRRTTGPKMGGQPCSTDRNVCLIQVTSYKFSKLLQARRKFLSTRKVPLTTQTLTQYLGIVFESDLSRIVVRRLVPGCTQLYYYY